MTELTDNDDYIIVACDGIWDTVSDADGYQQVKQEEGDCNAKSKSLLVKAVKAGSQDNVTAIVVRL